MTLLEVYAPLLAGFEQFNFSEEKINAFRLQFDQALYDLKACQSCNGDRCRTFVNRGKKDNDRVNYYYALSAKGCALYKIPTFVLFKCSSILQRKEEIYAAIRRAKKEGE